LKQGSFDPHLVFNGVLKEEGVLLELTIKPAHTASFTWGTVNIPPQDVEKGRDFFEAQARHEVGHRTVPYAPSTVERSIAAKKVAELCGIEDAHSFLNVVFDLMVDARNYARNPEVYGPYMDYYIRHYLSSPDPRMRLLGEVGKLIVGRRSRDRTANKLYELLFMDGRHFYTRLREIAVLLKHLFTGENARKHGSYGSRHGQRSDEGSQDERGETGQKEESGSDTVPQPSDGNTSSESGNDTGEEDTKGEEQEGDGRRGEGGEGTETGSDGVEDTNSAESNDDRDVADENAQDASREDQNGEDTGVEATESKSGSTGDGDGTSSSDSCDQEGTREAQDEEGGGVDEGNDGEEASSGAREKSGGITRGQSQDDAEGAEDPSGAEDRGNAGDGASDHDGETDAMTESGRDNESSEHDARKGLKDEDGRVASDAEDKDGKHGEPSESSEVSNVDSSLSATGREPGKGKDTSEPLTLADMPNPIIIPDISDAEELDLVDLARELQEAGVEPGEHLLYGTARERALFLTYRRLKLLDRFVEITEKIGSRPNTSETPETWRIGDDPEKLDLIETIQRHGVIIPGVTTIKKGEGNLSGAGGSGSIMLIVDTSDSTKDAYLASGSSQPKRIIDTIREAAFCIAESARRNGDEIGYVEFAGDVKYRVPPTRTDYEEIINRILVMTHGGGTNVLPPAVWAQQQLQKSPQKVTTFLITDGEIGDLKYAMPTLEWLNKKGRLVVFLITSRDPNTGKIPERPQMLVDRGFTVYMVEAGGDFSEEALIELNSGE